MMRCQIRSDGSTGRRCDCLTNDMKTNYLRETLKEGTYNVVPTAESEMKAGKTEVSENEVTSPD